MYKSELTTPILIVNDCVNPPDDEHMALIPAHLLVELSNMYHPFAHETLSAICMHISPAGHATIAVPLP